MSLGCDDSGEAGVLSLSKYNVETGARSTGGGTLGNGRPEQAGLPVRSWVFNNISGLVSVFKYSAFSSEFSCSSSELSTVDTPSSAGFCDAWGVTGPMSITTLSRLISKTSWSSEWLVGTSQMVSTSHKARSIGGFMLRLGQKTSNKLLRGIFVSVLCLAVALIRSTTVCSKSRFSCGSAATRPLKALIRDSEGGRMPVNDGMASVESDGGLRKPTGAPDFGLDGKVGPCMLRTMWGVSSDL